MREDVPGDADFRPESDGETADGVEWERNLPTLHEQQFPPCVEADEERLRFRLAVGIARELMGEEDGPDIWAMARSIYNNAEFRT